VKTRLLSTTFAAIAGVGLISSIAACNQTVATVDVGSCANTSDLTGEITDIPTIECTESHDAQVVGKFDLDDGDFPGDEGIASAAEEGCRGQFETFIGISFDESSLSMNYIGPSEDTWNEADDREVICFAISSEPATESWEGAAI